jgi:tetratricopeptide (TPR) repeat protein
MATDLYKLCPCGSGKKIKFCCRDIISDLERIHRMIDGEQRLAALEKIEKLLRQYPRRPALLCEKARVHIQLEQWAEAHESVATLLAEDQQSMTGLSLRSLLSIHDGDLGQAVQDVHAALRLANRIITASVYEAVFSLCLGFLSSGNALAARSYLMLLVSLSRGEDRRALALLLELDADASLSLLLKDAFFMLPCPDRVTWRREFDLAIEAERGADWWEAARKLEDMATRILDEPAILRNLAVLKGRLGEPLAAARYWRSYSQVRGIQLDDAVEAEARAQLLEAQETQDHVDQVEVTVEIADADSVLERMRSDGRFVMGPAPRQPASEDEPPPKAGGVLIDRPMPASVEGLESDQVPLQVAAIFIYGRETDRAARLQVVLPRDERFEPVLQQVSDIAGVPIDAAAANIFGQSSRLVLLLSPRLIPPHGMSEDQRRECTREKIRHAIVHEWPRRPWQVLQGRTPIDAVSQPRGRVPVLAAILNLELLSDARQLDLDLNPLRQQLGLPTRDPFDPSGLDLSRLSLCRVSQVDVEKLPDEELQSLYHAFSSHHAPGTVRKLAVEILRRPGLHDKVDPVEVYAQLANVAFTTEETLEYLGQARQLAVSRGESPANWLVSELEVHLTRGDAAAAQRLLHEIQSRYMQVPGIPQALAEVLTQFGLLKPTGRPVESFDALPGEQAEAASRGAAAGLNSGGIWTPDSDRPSAATPGQESSKIWVPGMD